MVQSVVSINHLQKSFGKFQALKDITFDVQAGEVFGFIGPNGAGKSTTIRVLLGILKANSGQATIFNEDVWQNAVAIHNRIAYVPGDVYLWPNLTGGEMIDFLLKLNHQKHSTTTDELIHEFELDPKKKSRNYSKGNRQKVALIAALSTAADLYIFDEPTSGLDPLMEELFQKHVLALKQQGKSVLLSSHILSEVERMCDRIGIIRGGEIIETGTLEQMRQLTRTQVIVQAKQSLAGVESLAGVHDFRLDSHVTNKAVFAVDTTQIGQVMADLAKREIVTLQTTPPTLEDLFMHYYNAEGAEDHDTK
ncbi:ABC transporter ATP-binding protein [Lactobacillus sp. LC28-10]|uniref:ABC transporter ATP-binding protein n=1 Tax=Secundilactobacillus angelensis TaxID=2722706 RepID=A0ABX1KZB6_9LACO|nr:ABC transporter ATP-binding protein [Secundilactobacillus angelensis]MCH5461919.1 ABC transporter ATP-binding protein [Secundilactobacillus angelensis]NLR17406.1 ABC transporter ATP-binding protein [Secundilactobacillus angelensis]